MKKILLFVSIILISVSSCKPEPVPDIKSDVSIYKENLTVPSKYLMDEEAYYSIYLPVDYETSGKKYPVLYLLHGMFSDNTEWNSKGDVVAITDEFIKSGKILPFIIVIPNADNSFYVDNFDFFDGEPGHKYESFFFKEFMPYIEANYPVLTDRVATCIAGLSMGGYGASYYGFKYPERFSFSYSMSGAIEGLDWTTITDKVPSVEDIFKSKGYKKEYFSKLPVYFIDCGTDDILCKQFNDTTHEFLDSINFKHTFREYEGGHSWEYWKESYKRMLPDLADQFFKIN